jgi:hypothetical protein
MFFVVQKTQNVAGKKVTSCGSHHHFDVGTQYNAKQVAISSQQSPTGGNAAADSSQRSHQ